MIQNPSRLGIQLPQRLLLSLTCVDSLFFFVPCPECVFGVIVDLVWIESEVLGRVWFVHQLKCPQQAHQSLVGLLTLKFLVQLGRLGLGGLGKSHCQG